MLTIEKRDIRRGLRVLCDILREFAYQGDRGSRRGSWM